ncbi:MAG TPA: XrtA/PEP-CTERM system TPR-repeat protein PrsT [Rhodanobacteraceae bacterium]
MHTNMQINRQVRALRFVLLALCAGLLLSGCGLANRHGSVAAGQKYAAEGKFRAAYIEAKKVLQHDNKNGEAWLLLGKASLGLGNPKDALTELEKAQTAGVPKAEWAVPMGEALLVTRQYDKLLATLTPDSSFKPKLAARVQVLRGDAERAEDKPDAAKQSYQAALKIEPKDARALVGLARLASGTQDSEAANRYLQQALAAEPENPQAWVAKGDLAFENHDYAGAEADFQKVLGFKNPDWLPQDAFYARARLADSEIRQNQYDKALGNLETLEKMAPEQPYPHYLHAVVLYQQGHLGDAVSQLQQVLKVSPDNVPAQLLLGAVTYAQGNYGQAEMYLGNVMGADQKNVAARKLLALTYYREGRSQQALGTLRPVMPEKATDAELLALLQRAAAAKAGMPNAMASAESMAGAATPAPSASTGGPLAHAEQALASGNASEAISLLKAAPAGDDAAQAKRTAMLVMAYVRNKQAGEAAKTAADFAARHPKDSAAHLLYGTALVADNQRDKARAQYDQAVKLDPKNLAALMSLGSLDTLEHNYTGAQSQYDAVLKQNPNNAAAMVALGKLAAMQGDNATAIKQFKQAIAAVPKDANAYVSLVMLYSESGQFNEAAKVARQLADVEPNNPAALNAVGAAELNAGQHADALAPLAQAVKLAPQVPLYRINLARAQILAKNTKDATSNLEQVIKDNPDEVQAVDLLAFLKLQDHDLPGALSLAHSLQQKPNTKAAGYSLEGDLYMADKAYAKAAAAYQQGLKADYARPLVVKTYVAMSNAGDKQANTVLTAWLAKHSDDAAMHLLLAQDYLTHAQDTQAAGEYEKVLKAYPSNVDALNNLAWIYTQQHDPKALAMAERAYKLAPKSPGVMDTYGWALIQANQPKVALPILTQAAKAAPKVPAIQYHLAVALARTGDKEGARTTLAALQKTGGNFDDKPAAEKLYAELGGASK